MATILVVRDVLGPSGEHLTQQGHFIDDSDLDEWTAAGWRLPLGAPDAPIPTSYVVNLGGVGSAIVLPSAAFSALPVKDATTLYLTY